MTDNDIARLRALGWHSVLALLAERDALRALLAEARELINPPLSGTERRLADRIDAALKEQK